MSTLTGESGGLGLRGASNTGNGGVSFQGSEEQVFQNLFTSFLKKA